MKQTPHIQAFVIGLALVLLGGEIVKAEMPPLEPEEIYLVEEDVNIITGLYTREYSLRQDGVVDYKTARQIIISEYNEYWNTVVETKEFPLFYWHDAKRDGNWRMYVDQQVEGCTCDIVPYEVRTEEALAVEDPFLRQSDAPRQLPESATNSPNISTP